MNDDSGITPDPTEATDAESSSEKLLRAQIEASLRRQWNPPADADVFLDSDWQDGSVELRVEGSPKRVSLRLVVACAVATVSLGAAAWMVIQFALSGSGERPMTNVYAKPPGIYMALEREGFSVESTATDTEQVAELLSKRLGLTVSVRDQQEAQPQHRVEWIGIRTAPLSPQETFAAIARVDGTPVVLLVTRLTPSLLGGGGVMMPDTAEPGQNLNVFSQEDPSLRWTEVTHEDHVWLMNLFDTK